MAVLHHHIAVDDHIVVLALLHRLIDAMPSTQVSPSEVALHHRDILRLLQDGKIHGDVRVRREVLLHIGILRSYIEDAIRLIETSQHGRENFGEALTKMLHIGEEDACVPIELATLYEYLSEVTLRFLGERLHIIEVVALGIT